MKPKIFKKALASIVLMLALQTVGYGQNLDSLHTELEKNAQQLKIKLKAFKLQQDDFKIQQKSLEKLQRKLASKEFTDSFKYLDENLADAFKNFGAFDNLPGMPNAEWNFIQSNDAKERTKTYSKTYSIGNDDKVIIDNRFGNVTVNTWTNNEIRVDVQIKVDADNDDDAQNMLNTISIGDSKNGSSVTFKTKIGTNDNDSWGGWGSSKNHARKLEINYTVYLPTKISLDITNKFGAVILPDFDGKLVINNSFGSLAAKTLTNTANEINVKYGSASITGFSGSTLKVSYGSLNLAVADNLNADISYSSASIGRVKKSGNVMLRYSGGFKIADLDKSVKNFTINSSYSGVTLGVSDIPAFDFDVTVRYGSFNYNDSNVSITDKSPADGDRGWSPIKSYKGHYGKGNTEKQVVVNANYGNVSFN